MKQAPDYPPKDNVIDLKQYKFEKEKRAKKQILEILFEQIQTATKFYQEINNYNQTAQLCAANKYFEQISHNEEMFSFLTKKITNNIQEERDIPIRNILNTLDSLQKYDCHPIDYLIIKELLSNIKPIFNESTYHQKFSESIKNLQSKCSSQSFYSGQNQ
ncbi:MAG: hypothetical protein WC570_01695 [Patescibacteria group bacterium]